MEDRRIQAAVHLKQGWGVTRVARYYGVQRSAVYLWVDRIKLGSIKATRGTGRHKKLNMEQIDMLRSKLNSPGLVGKWTSGEVQSLIESSFGVRYHVCSIPRLVRENNLCLLSKSRGAK